MSSIEDQMKWDRLRKLTGSTMFDGNKADARSVEAAARHARMKLQKKLDEVNRLEFDLLALAGREETRR